MARAANITRTAIEARSATKETGGGFLEVINSHLQHTCGVATDDEVPAVWAEVAGAGTVTTKISLLTQFLQTDLSECRHKFFGHIKEMLHVSLPLFNFIMKGRFSNIASDSACPVGGFLWWTSPQGLTSDKGAAIAATEADAVARDLRLATANQIAHSSKMVLNVVVDRVRADL